MPTVGIQPTLKSTQAVGAVLLHQFARDRFVQAGIDDNLIRQAEDREHLEDLTAILLQENDPETDNNNLSTSNIINQNMSPNTSSSSHNASSSLDSTTDEQFQTIIAETSSNCQDRTIYHSMNASQSPLSSLDRLQCSPTLATYGRELRRIAEEFEKDRLRQTVKDRAEQVKLSDINKESFVQLLEELFQDKITRERIVILFFFCTDVALRAASFGSELVINLMGWSFSYIINTVCSLVHKLGGWDKVLFYQLPSILVSCCAALVICSLIVYLRNSLRGG